MKFLLSKIWFGSFVLIFSFTMGSCSTSISQKVAPIHLDDIHIIATNEEATVAFFEKHFGAREMAHPGERFDLVRFLSLKWQGPTITITPIGPYDDLPAERNQRWIDAKIILPKSEKTHPVYGIKWLAVATPSLKKARLELLEGGIKISENAVSLPLEPTIPAFSVFGPDGIEILIVERPEFEFDDAKYAIDHVQFLVKDVKITQKLFEEVFAAKPFQYETKSIGMQVADAKLILSEPEAFGMNQKEVSPRRAEGTIRIGFDHLGFLFRDVKAAVVQAETKGYAPIFQPTRYIYKNKPTVYTFTAFSLPEEFNIEMVQAEGRIGPHSYYIDQN